MDKLGIKPFEIHIPDIDGADLSGGSSGPTAMRSLELIKIFDEIFAGKDLAPNGARSSSTATGWCSAWSAFSTTFPTTGR
jgi:hypothetical protein